MATGPIRKSSSEIMQSFSDEVVKKASVAIQGAKDIAQLFFTAKGRKSIAMGAASGFVSGGRMLKNASPGFVKGTLKREIFTDMTKEPELIKSALAGDQRLQDAFARVSEFDVTPKLPFDTPPVNKAQLDLAAKKMTEAKNPEERKKYADFLGKCDQKGVTRDDFNSEDLKVLDEINFELIQENMEDLTALFNTELYNNFSDDFHKRTVGDFKEALVSEVLAKGLAYTAGCSGKELKVPVKIDGKYELKTFSLERANVGKEMPAYILCPEDLNVEPWIVFRGTEVLLGQTESGSNLREGSLESVLSDLDKDGVGYTAFQESLDPTKPGSLGDHLEGLRRAFPRGYKVTGHSLGGTFAAMLNGTERDVDKVTCYTHAATGVHPDHYDEFRNLDKAIHIAGRWDTVPAWGKHNEKDHYVQVSHPGKDKIDPVRAHMRYDLIPRSGQRLVMDSVDIKAENAKPSREFAFKVREFARRIAYGKIESMIKKREEATQEEAVEAQMRGIQNFVTDWGVDSSE